MGITEVQLDGNIIDLSTLVKEAVGDTEAYVLPVELYANDALSEHEITLTLSHGETARFRVSLASYLEALKKDDPDNEKLVQLIEDLTSYLVASSAYFHGTNARLTVSAAAQATYIQDASYSENSEPNTLSTTEVVREVTDSGLASATLMLGEKPVFLFKTTAETATSDFVFTIDGVELSYTRGTIGGATYLFVYLSPAQLRDTISWTVDGASGSYNLKAYYEFSKAQAATLPALVKRLWRYSEACEAYVG